MSAHGPQAVSIIAQHQHNLKVDSSTVPLVDLLERTTINDLVGERELLAVREDTPLREVISVLASSRILSVPVMCKDSRDVLGFIDLLDILTSIVSIFSMGKTVEEAQWSSWSRDIASLKAKGEDLAYKRAVEVMQLSMADPFMPVYGQGTLLQAIEYFASGLHRAAVFNKITSLLTNIITQSDVVAFLSKNLTGDSLGLLAGTTIGELHLSPISTTANVVSMSTSAQAIHAVYLMFFHKVSAVAIADQNGKLVGNFSASDLRGIGEDNLQWLLDPISDFLRLIGLRTNKLSFPLTCRRDTKVEDVINMLSTYRLHRVWIVDHEHKPIGVVTLTDILRLFLPDIPELQQQKQPQQQQKSPEE